MLIYIIEKYRKITSVVMRKLRIMLEEMFSGERGRIVRRGGITVDIVEPEAVPNRTAGYLHYEGVLRSVWESSPLLSRVILHHVLGPMGNDASCGRRGTACTTDGCRKEVFPIVLVFLSTLVSVG